MKKIINKKLYKRLLFIGILIYVIFTFVNQQKTLISYKNEQKYYNEQIEIQEQQKQALVDMKENVNSTEYIEKIAREKLDMYYPNERVYIDMSK